MLAQHGIRFLSERYINLVLLAYRVTHGGLLYYLLAQGSIILWPSTFAPA